MSIGQVIQASIKADLVMKNYMVHWCMWQSSLPALTCLETWAWNPEEKLTCCGFCSGMSSEVKPSVHHGTDALHRMTIKPKIRVFKAG